MNYCNDHKSELTKHNRRQSVQFDNSEDYFWPHLK
jgi:hypothetical protein